MLVTAVLPIPYKPTIVLWGSLPLPSASGLSESLPLAGKPICLLCSLLDLPRGSLHVVVLRKINQCPCDHCSDFLSKQIPKLPHPHYSTTSVSQLKAHKHPLASHHPFPALVFVGLEQMQSPQFQNSSCSSWICVFSNDAGPQSPTGGFRE